MILSFDSVAEPNNENTPPPARRPDHSTPPSRTRKWRVVFNLACVVELARPDAASSEDAVRVAREIMRKGPLVVTVNGVPLATELAGHAK